MNPWDSYRLNEIDPWWVRNELPRRAARSMFAQFLESRAERVRELSSLLGRFGVRLDGSDESVAALNDWFRTAVEPLAGEDEKPDGMTLSICEDVAVFLGEITLQRHPNLHWELVTTSRNSSEYHSPVVAGFTGEPAWRTIDLSRNVLAYAIGVLQDRIEVLPDVTVEVRGRELVLPGESLRFAPDPGEFVSYLRLAAELNEPGPGVPKGEKGGSD